MLEHYNITIKEIKYVSKSIVQATIYINNEELRFRYLVNSSGRVSKYKLFAHIFDYVVTKYGGGFYEAR